MRIINKENKMIDDKTLRMATKANLYEMTFCMPDPWRTVVPTMLTPPPSRYPPTPTLERINEAK